MRVWTYSWKTPDGLRHEGEMGAPSKDAVYAALRERGIRAIRVSERIQPVVRRGFAGLRKRDWSLIISLAVLVAGAVIAVGVQFAPSKLRAPVTDECLVERIAPDPASKDALMQLVNERKANEEVCREKLVRRVKDGTLSKEVANEIFRAMGLREIE